MPHSLQLVRAGCLLLVLTLQAMPSGAAQAPCPCLPVVAPCPSTPALDLTAVCARLEALDAKVTTLQAQVKTQGEKKPLLQTLLMNRYVDMLLAATVAAVTVRVMK